MKKKLTLMKELVENLHSKDRKKLYNIIWSYDGQDLTTNERYSILRVAYREALKDNPKVDEIIKAVNMSCRKAHTRLARLDVGTAIRSGEYVAYLCSKHMFPAKDHKDYQGKLYYDRYWRSKLNDKDKARMEKAIKRHGIHMSVQKVMGAPIYMCVRPNCKHYMVGITLDELERYSVDDLLVVKGAISYTRNLTRKERYERYKQVKKALHK